MSGLDEQLREAELRKIREDRIHAERAEAAKVPALIALLTRVEKQLTELTVQMSEVARILRSD